MKIGVLIDCRSESAGGPGSALTPVLGKPAVSHLVDLLRRDADARSEALPVMLSTTGSNLDDRLDAYAASASLPLVRRAADGEDDDLDGVVEGAQRLGLDWVAVVGGETALVDPHVVWEAVEKAVADDLDLVSTAPGSTFPSGMRVEVARTSFLAGRRSGAAEARRESRRDASTSLFERWPGLGRRDVLHNTTAPGLARLRVGLDTPSEVRLASFCLRHVLEEPGRSVLETVDRVLHRYAPVHPWTGSHGPLLIAEIGSNHEGDFARARALTEQAIGAGPDFVKFQIYTGDSLVSPVADPKRHGHFQKFELTPDQHLELARMCAEAGVGYLASVWDPSALAWIDPALELYKIGSGDLVATSVLRRVAAQGKPIMLSTGLGTEDDVTDAVNTLAGVDARYRAPEWLALLQCTSAYPIEARDANLAVMRRLHERTGLPTGYSDHTEGTAALELAAVLGARVLEFHFTDRRADPSFRDHLVSLLPEEVARLARHCDAVVSLLGGPRKHPLAIEVDTGQVRSSRRALYPTRDLPTDHRLEPDDLVALRPNDGIDAHEIDRIVGRRLLRNLRALAPIQWDDLGDD